MEKEKKNTESTKLPVSLLKLTKAPINYSKGRVIESNVLDTAFFHVGVRYKPTSTFF